MKIFLIIPTLRQGGAERVMSELANNFHNLGHEIHLILLAESYEFYLVNSKIHIHRLGFKNLGFFNKIVSEFRTLFKLRFLFKLYRPNVTLSFMEKYNILTILSSRFLNLNVFVSDRSNPFKKLPFIIKVSRKILYIYATGIVAQTNSAKDQLENKLGKLNIEVISNPVRVIEQNPLIKREKIILNAGRLVNEKGQKYLLEAFSKITDQSWNLVILGEGPLREELTSQSNSLEISHRVFMPGSVTNIDEWLSKSSIFAFSSVSEGFPNSLVEAMSAGLPCVSFDCSSGPSDIIDNGINGYLIEVGNVKLLAKQLSLLIEDLELRTSIGNEAKKVNEKFYSPLIAKQYLEFFIKSSKF